MPSPLLTVRAGPDALRELREHGLQASRVRSLIGASGGPKWLTLHGIDRVLFPWLLAGVAQPLHAIGSSIGSWRHACLTAPEPLAAIDRFAQAYVEQSYRRKPTAADVSAEGERILDILLGPDGVAPLVAHARVRTHIVTARFRHLGAFEGPLQSLALGVAALANAMHRRALGISVERVVFDAGNDPGPFAPWGALPTRHATLSTDNARHALLASAAIPGVMLGVRDPAGAPRGTYRDGGVTDYHFGPEIDLDDGLALYPHFYPHLVPGWFDKLLGTRRTRGLRRVVVIAPSAAFVASLPGERIPDRNDFVRMSTKERIAAWQRVLDLGAQLGHELGELLGSDRIARAAEPLD